MIFSKSQHIKILENSFKTTEDGKFIFFPGLRPRIFQGFLIPNEQIKDHVLWLIEQKRKFDNISCFVLIIAGGILGGEIGYLLAFILVVIPWFVGHQYWQKRIANIFSKLEVYDGPDSLPPLG